MDAYDDSGQPSTIAELEQLPDPEWYDPFDESYQPPTLEELEGIAGPQWFEPLEESYQPPTMAEIEELMDPRWIESLPTVGGCSPQLGVTEESSHRGNAGFAKSGPSHDRVPIVLSGTFNTKGYTILPVVPSSAPKHKRMHVCDLATIIDLQAAGPHLTAPDGVQIAMRSFRNLPIDGNQQAIAQALATRSQSPVQGVFQGVCSPSDEDENACVVYVVGPLTNVHQTAPSAGYQAQIVWKYGRDCDVVGSSLWYSKFSGSLGKRPNRLYDPILPPLPASLRPPEPGTTEERNEWRLRARNAGVKEGVIELWLDVTAHECTDPEPKLSMAQAPQ